MKVLIDLTDLKPGEMGGIEQYARDLVDGFSNQSFHSNEFTLLLTGNNAGYFKNLPAHISTMVVKSDSLVGRLMMKRGRLKSAWLQAQGIQAGRFDLVHFPFQAVRFEVSELPSVVSIMDIQHEIHPEFFTPSEVTARRYMYPYSTSKASRVIAISQATAASLYDYYQVSLDKIDIIHLAVNMPPLSVKPKRQKRLFYPAATWPHKNHINLIEAFHIFHNDHPEYELHLSGAKKQSYEPMQERIRELGLTDIVVHHGYPSDSVIAELMASSRAVIFPSLFEGFGIPVIESMMHKTPVACSNLEVLREVCGSAALYFDPRSVSGIAQAMDKVCFDGRLREKLILTAKSVVGDYTVSKMALSTINTYEKVLHAK